MFEGRGRPDPPAVLQFHDSDPSAALLGGRLVEARYERMLLQNSCQSSLELTSSVPVDQTHCSLIREQRLVEKPFRQRDGFVDRAADDVQVCDGRLTRLQVEVDLHAASG